MQSEHKRREKDTWNEDVVLFEARFRLDGGPPSLVWGQIEGQKERSLPWHLTPERVPGCEQMTSCWEVGITAYTLEPRIVLTVETTPSLFYPALSSPSPGSRRREGSNGRAAGRNVGITQKARSPPLRCMKSSWRRVDG